MLKTHFLKTSSYPIKFVLLVFCGFISANLVPIEINTFTISVLDNTSRGGPISTEPVEQVHLEIENIEEQIWGQLTRFSVPEFSRAMDSLTEEQVTQITQSELGEALVYRFLKSDYLELFRFFLSKNKQMLSRLNNGSSLMHLAAKFGKDRAVRMLVDEFEMIADIRDSLNRTPLHSTSMFRFADQEVIETLLGLHTQENSPDTQQIDFAFKVAVLSGSEETARLIFTSYPEVALQRVGDDQQSLLHAVARNNLVEKAKFLVEVCNIDAEITDDRGQRPIDLATSRSVREYLNKVSNTYSSNIVAR